MSNERVLVAAIQRAILREHPTAWVFKVVGSPYQEAGVPDLLACVEGRLIGLEVKHPKPGESPLRAYDRATPLQRRQIQRIRAAGGVAGVVLSVEEAMGLIDTALDNDEIL